MTSIAMSTERTHAVESKTAAESLSASPSPFARAPFVWTQRDRQSLPVRVEGALPTWLNGELVRTAPAVFDQGSFHAAHLFDGLGLIYGFEFTPKGIRYKQRQLDCKMVADVTSERPQRASFATPTRRSVLQRLRRPVPPISDNANVNIVPWQGAWLAMTESPHQHLIDGESLASRGIYTYDDGLPRGLAMTAHPHFDFERRALVNVGMQLGPKNQLWVLRHDERTRTRVVEGKLTVKRMPYVHSFGLTSRHAVLIEHPYSINPLSLLFRNSGYMEPFAWQTGRSTRLWRLERTTGQWTRYETDPLFCFHAVNTFEDGQDTVLDMVAFDDASVVQQLRRSALGNGLPSLIPRFVRARLRPGRSHAELEPLAADGFEFPVIPYRTDNGRPYEVAWGARLSQRGGGNTDSQIVRIEVGRGVSAVFEEPGMAYGEPVFAPRPDATRSDDGVLLCVGSHAHEERSTLAVLRADTLEPLARVQLDLSIPLGFHGSFAQRQG